MVGFSSVLYFYYLYGVGFFYDPFLTTSCGCNFFANFFVEEAGAFFVIYHTWSFIGYFFLLTIRL